MRTKRGKGWLARSTAVAGATIAALALASSASAHEGAFAKFDQCPSTNAEVFKCLVSVTNGGEVILGSKKVPIVNPVTLQGGVGKANVETKVSKFFEAANKVTLSPTAQPVPGGLLGLVPPEESPPLIKELVELAVKNGLNEVNSTLELAGSASEIQVSENHLSRKEGVALRMPIKVHLENAFLGSSCYVGSNASPIIWELTSGKTSPPGPNESISGSAGKIEFLEEGEILNLNENVLVDNAWSAPGASGCGGLLSALVDPVLDAASGLPAAAGTNTAILNNTIGVALAESVNEH